MFRICRDQRYSGCDAVIAFKRHHTTHVLLQGVPRGFDLKAIRAAVSDAHGVTSIRELHLWSVAGGDASLTVHVAVDEGSNTKAIPGELADMLDAQFNIHHVTIQIKIQPCGDVEACTLELR